MSIARDVTTVGGGTLMSRLLAFARDSGIAALLGIGPFAEAFFAMLQVINFFRRLLAEGELNSAFVPGGHRRRRTLLRQYFLSGYRDVGVQPLGQLAILIPFGGSVFAVALHCLGVATLKAVSVALRRH